MKTVLDIDRLTQTEKLRAMQELWEDLTKNEDEYPSPVWHADELREREEALKNGKDGFVLWEVAKKMLRAAPPQGWASRGERISHSTV